PYRGGSRPRAVTAVTVIPDFASSSTASSKLLTVGQTWRGSNSSCVPMGGTASLAGTSTGRCSSLGLRGSHAGCPTTAQVGIPASAATALCPASHVNRPGAGWLTTVVRTCTAAVSPQEAGIWARLVVSL